MNDEEQQPILIVEDDEIILNSIEFLLTDEGYHVITATNGREALERLRQNDPRLILLDMKMPVMDGWEFARAYHQQPSAHAPVIVMTATRDAMDWAAEVGADAYIAKPFDVERLLDLVHQYMQA